MGSNELKDVLNSFITIMKGSPDKNLFDNRIESYENGDQVSERKSNKSVEASRGRDIIISAKINGNDRNHQQNYGNENTHSPNVNQEKPYSTNIPNKGVMKQGGCKDIKGTLISVENNWGLVAVGKQSYIFYSPVVYFFGLKVEHLPLNQILHPDQVASVYLEGETVKVLKYGSSVTSSVRENAISLYCKNNSISDEIKNLLEDLHRRNSQEDND